jgi:phosphonate transport system ATP-binding protein
VSIPVELRQASFAPAPGARTSALKGLTLRIEAGEQVAVIGASGAGKSTLLMALACALPPTDGALSLFGHDPWRLSTRERQALRGRLFLAPQVPPLPPRQRVVASVLAGQLPAMGLWQSVAALWQPGARAAGAQQALAEFDLADKLWERVDRLSGGERQRVGLARALVSRAELWLVDEPLSALDPPRAQRAMQVLQEHAGRGGRTLVCSLHQVDVARERFPRLVALRRGECVYDGPPAGLDDAALAALYAGDAASPPSTPAPAPASAALPQAMCR